MSRIDQDNKIKFRLNWEPNPLMGSWRIISLCWVWGKTQQNKLCHTIERYSQHYLCWFRKYQLLHNNSQRKFCWTRQAVKSSDTNVILFHLDDKYLPTNRTWTLHANLPNVENSVTTQIPTVKCQFGLKCSRMHLEYVRHTGHLASVFCPMRIGWHRGSSMWSVAHPPISSFFVIHLLCQLNDWSIY